MSESTKSTDIFTHFRQYAEQKKKKVTIDIVGFIIDRTEQFHWKEISFSFFVV